MMSTISKNKFLTFILSMGWIVGSFPSATPNQGSTKFGFQVWSFATGYSIVCGICAVLIGFDYFIPTYTFQMLDHTVPLSNYVADSSSLLTYYTSDALLRFLAIRYCAKIIKIILTCGKIEKDLRELRNRVIKKSKRNKNNLGVYIFLGITLAAFFMYRIYIVLRYYVWSSELMDNAATISILFKGFPRTYFVANFCYDFFSTFSMCFPLTLAVLIGVKLIDLFGEFSEGLSLTMSSLSAFCEETKSETDLEIIASNVLDSRTHGSGCDRDIKMELHRFNCVFTKFKSLFVTFEEICGSFCAALLLQTVFSFMYGTTSLALSTGTFDEVHAGLGALQAFITMLLIAHLGERMKRKLRTWKDFVEATYRESDLGNDASENSIGKLVNSITTWEWGLTANNLFTIDYRLLPSIAATMMTYSIFMFQLKMTEMQENASKDPLFCSCMSNNATST